MIRIDYSLDGEGGIRQFESYDDAAAFLEDHAGDIEVHHAEYWDPEGKRPGRTLTASMTQHAILAECMECGEGFVESKLQWIYDSNNIPYARTCRDCYSEVRQRARGIDFDPADAGENLEPEPEVGGR